MALLERFDQEMNRQGGFQKIERYVEEYLNPIQAVLRSHEITGKTTRYLSPNKRWLIVITIIDGRLKGFLFDNDYNWEHITDFWWSGLISLKKILNDLNLFCKKREKERKKNTLVFAIAIAFKIPVSYLGKNFPL